MRLPNGEIYKSLYLSNFCLRYIGISFENPENRIQYYVQKILLFVCAASLSYHLTGDVIYIYVTLANLRPFEEVIAYFHFYGYGVISFAKIFSLWYKKDVCSSLINKLASDEIQLTNDKHLTILRIAYKWYVLVHQTAAILYYVTPLATYFYHVWRNEEVEFVFLWASWYPFDKNEPIARIFVCIFEIFIGHIAVSIMIGSDMLFSALASHICLRLRILQKRLKSFGESNHSDEENYKEIVENIKIHQRLIRYCNDLEDIFTVSNFFNIITSSFNICCVLFNILLIDPLIEIPNKMYLGWCLVQMGVLCWYGDNILHANGGVATSAYCSEWYRTGSRCRRGLLFLLVRTSKPIALTAMNFTNITLVTYSTILTRSYSYFALLYTIYKGHYENHE